MQSSEELLSLSSNDPSDNLGPIIQLLRPYIEARVTIHYIVSQMPCMREIYPQIYSIRKETDKAAGLFFDHLKKIEDPGKYKEFLQALENEKYPLVLSVIKGEVSNGTDDENGRLIGLFLKRIAEAITPDIMSQELQQRQIISPEEADRIRNLAKMESPLDAALYLLSRIHCHKESWYHEFLQVLWEMDLTTLVKDIDEKFYGKKMEKEKEQDLDSSFSPTSNDITEPHFERQELGVEEEFLSSSSFSQPGQENSDEMNNAVALSAPQEPHSAAIDHSFVQAVLKQLADMSTQLAQQNGVLVQITNRLDGLERKIDKILQKQEK